MEKFTFKDLRARYDKKTALVIAECRFATETVGGIAADRKGIENFVRHHMGIKDEDEIQSKVGEILKEEIGTADTTPDGGELTEKSTYGVHQIRRDEIGPWLGNWMAKACLKCAASRLRIFSSKRGAKGDMAEMGLVEAYGISARNPDHPERIYLVDADSDAPATTEFKTFSGRVQTPSGPTSIIHHSECAPEGTRFAFQFRYYPEVITKDDVIDMFACAMVIGLGSAKALERGKFSITELTWEDAQTQREKSADKPAKARKAKQAAA